MEFTHQLSDGRVVTVTGEYFGPDRTNAEPMFIIDAIDGLRCASWRLPDADVTAIESAGVLLGIMSAA